MSKEPLKVIFAPLGLAQQDIESIVQQAYLKVLRQIHLLIKMRIAWALFMCFQGLYALIL